MAKDKITLEDLLKLKRAEHPTDAQWREFDERMQDKLLECIVHKPALSERIFARYEPARVLKLCAASCAACAAVFTSLYLDGIFAKSADEVSEFRISQTPLPSVEASYAVKELPSLTREESPVFAQMNAGASDALAVHSIGTLPSF